MELILNWMIIILDLFGLVRYVRESDEYGWYIVGLYIIDW